jgi:hypothetical protein
MPDGFSQTPALPAMRAFVGLSMFRVSERLAGRREHRPVARSGSELGVRDTALVPRSARPSAGRTGDDESAVPARERASRHREPRDRTPNRPERPSRGARGGDARFAQATGTAEGSPSGPRACRWNIIRFTRPSSGSATIRGRPTGSCRHRVRCCRRASAANPVERAPSLPGSYRRACTSLAGSPVLSRDPRSGVRRQARSRMRHKDQVRATKLKQVARRLKNGSSKTRRLTPVKRAAEAERDYRRRRP